MNKAVVATPIFTICACGALPHARVLVESIASVNPAVNFIIFVVDAKRDYISRATLDRRVVYVDDIGIPNLDYMKSICTREELIQAVKPFCFRFLFSAIKQKQATYLDPCAMVLPAFHDFERAFSDGIEIMLVSPAEQANSGEDRVTTGLAQSGICDYPFVAMRNTEGTRQFLDLCCRTMQRDGIADIHDADANGFNTTPGFVERLRIERRSSVSYRPFPWSETRASNAQGAPVQFMLFGDIDRSIGAKVSRSLKWLMSKGCRRRTRLYKDYLRRIARSRFLEGRDLAQEPYAYGRSDERPIPPRAPLPAPDERWSSAAPTDRQATEPALQSGSRRTAFASDISERISPDAYCPCGSGSLFASCHGQAPAPGERRAGHKPLIIDGFTFFAEAELLQLRLELLWDVVDKFVVVEADHTHSGEKRAFSFPELARSRLAKYQSKIIFHPVHLAADGLDFTSKLTAYDPRSAQWKLENAQRDEIANACKDFDPLDILMISDIDEMPDPAALKIIFSDARCLENLPLTLRNHLIYYKLRYVRPEGWLGSVITTVGRARMHSTNWHRAYRDLFPVVPDVAGWHLTYFGGAERIRQKVRSFAHQEFNDIRYTAEEHISECMKDGTDIFGNGETPAQVSEAFFPQYLLDRVESRRDFFW